MPNPFAGNARSRVGRQNNGSPRTQRVPSLLNDRYRTLFNLAPIAIYSCDATGAILEYNNRAAELWGRKPKVQDTDERFCGSLKLYRPDGSFMPHEECPMGDVLSGKVPGTYDAEVHIERPDGSRIMVIVNIAPLKDNRGKIAGAINCFYDAVERKRTKHAFREKITECRRTKEARRADEVQLRHANEKLESIVQQRTDSLRQLSAKLMRSQDEEHRRIARNLHDGLGQYLVSIKMNLELLSRPDVQNKDEALCAALKSVEQGMAETRTLSCLLHPPLLEEVGFASAAHWYTDEFAKRGRIKVKLDLPEGVDRLPELVRIALFRILQESLTNVHRHSGSSAVEVHLTTNEHKAMLTVKDFGRGMPAELIHEFPTKGAHFGVGLRGIQERVNDLGGSFEIVSSGEGTTLMASIPLALEHAS